MYQFLLRYGKHEGLQRWNSYIEKQRNTNTFEYKQQKYGMTIEEFNEYNKSRAVTLKNCVKRHGVDKGTEIYQNYIKKQRKNGCQLEYFIEKYGKDDGLMRYNQVCSHKALTLENFQRKYGREEGYEKYQNYVNGKSAGWVSFVSQRLFWKLPMHENVYFHEYNHEFGLMDIKNKTYYKYDYVDTINKKCIEFNGDFWHLNPKIYDKTDRNAVDMVAEDVWERDARKIELISSLGYDVMVVWESDFYDDSRKVIEKCMEFLSDKD